MRISDLTMERLTAALGQYTDSAEGLGSNDVKDYTWKRNDYNTALLLLKNVLGGTSGMSVIS